MIKRGSRGLELSFAMIFSIIIIIAIIGASFYVIKNFLDLQRCTEQALFYDDFQNQIDKTWRSEISKTTYSGTMPSGIESVCLGDLSSGNFNPRYKEEYQKFEKYFRFDANLFLYPPEKACSPEYFKLEHVDLSNFQSFDCIEIENKKFVVRLEKDSYDPLVKVMRE